MNRTLLPTPPPQRTDSTLRRTSLAFLLVVTTLAGLWLNCRDLSPRKPHSPDASAEQSAPDQRPQDAPPAERPVATKVAPTVLLISLDGFRWDYFDTADTPHLSRLMREGVKAKSLIPVFPSKTFPNHYTIVTGLYPENHGIVSNTMYDPVFRERFTITDAAATRDGKWWEGEPIWVTAVKQGQRSATMFWPGSDAPIQNTRPTHWRAYDGRISHSDRVKQVLQWLDLPPDKRPTFLTLYFEDVDTAGHANGPHAFAVTQAIQKVDKTLGTLLQGLEARGLLDTINIVVVSDHGMAELSLDRRIVLSDYIDLNDVYINEISMVLGLNPKAGKEQKVYEQLKGKHPRLAVYKRDEIPAHLHYRKHRRISQIVGIADEGWTVVVDPTYTGIYKGSHGYDPKVPSMHGILLARGPAFRVNAQIPSVSSVHLYALFCHILSLKPATNDGDLSQVKNMLR